LLSRVVSRGCARVIAERFFERFEVGDLDGAFESFSPDRVADPVGADEH
jgi:hypothetical protein